MEQAIKKERFINTIHVFTENDQVYTKRGEYQRSHVPLRWIPVYIPK